jgi:LPXTG-motif cell wall-anchored protein
MRRRASRLLIGGFVLALLAGSSFMPAGGAEKKVNLGSFVGQAGSHAVRISIGDIELTVGGGQSDAAYKRTQNSPIKLGDQLAKAVSRGVVIPGLADSQVSCEPPKLADEVTALSVPEALAPVLSLDLGMASCALGGVKGLPTAEHAAGEVLAEIRLTETVVNSVPQVNEFLNTLQGSLTPLPEAVRGQVNSVIDALQERLASQPLLQIRVAPNRGNVTSTSGGISSLSPGRAVVIDVLGGVLEVELAVGEAVASVADGKPTAAADVAFAHVKALNILTPDPDDALIDQKISAPQDLHLLAGTPLETIIATERGLTSTACSGALASNDACASATADAVALSLLADPLPNIGVELVHTEVLAAGNFGSPVVKKATPVLPKTGAGTTGVVFGGLGLAVVGLGLRRRFLR